MTGKNVFMKIVLIALFFMHLNAMDAETFKKQKDELKQQSLKFQFGDDIVLDEDEKKISNLLMSLKDIESAFNAMNGINLQEKNYLEIKDYIEQSEIFRIIQMMPKGAINHIHDTSLFDIMPLIKKFGYDPALYVCFDEKIGIHQFKFAENISDTDGCVWKSVNEDRKEFGNNDTYDNLLWSNFTITVDDIKESNSQNEIWQKFQNKFVALNSFICYSQVWIEYYLRALQHFISKENVQFIEIRSTLPLLYDTTSSQIDPKQTFMTYVEADSQLRKHFKDDYVGSKIIYAPLRSMSKEEVKEAVTLAMNLYETYEDHFSGFDLVGQEDAGKSLEYFMEELLLPKKLGKKLPYIFHAGETDLFSEVGDNLYDAILLNTTRIGHGFALTKHTHLKNLAKEKDIPIELCPISNQLLGLIGDLRDHPATSLFAENFPVTVSPDDPGIFQTQGVSHDLYQVFMGMLPKNAGLKALKKLVLNSIKYSSLEGDKKKKLEDIWMKKWRYFVKSIVKLYGLK